MVSVVRRYKDPSSFLPRHTFFCTALETAFRSSTYSLLRYNLRFRESRASLYFLQNFLVRLWRAP